MKQAAGRENLQDGVLTGLLFNPEDRGYTLLRNVG
jgi:hypothetical protein